MGALVILVLGPEYARDGKRKSEEHDRQAMPLCRRLGPAGLEQYHFASR
jgi:hypothetical protein